ncbi:MAG: hypothetical protein Q7S65_06420 [Nanoarchaeota archaeon]|nr:hypothetical protein [Nanoarchaeota archaeon]
MERSEFEKQIETELKGRPEWEYVPLLGSASAGNDNHLGVVVRNDRSMLVRVSVQPESFVPSDIGKVAGKDLIDFLVNAPVRRYLISGRTEFGFLDNKGETEDMHEHNETAFQLSLKDARQFSPYLDALAYIHLKGFFGQSARHSEGLYGENGRGKNYTSPEENELAERILRNFAGGERDASCYGLASGGIRFFSAQLTEDRKLPETAKEVLRAQGGCYGLRGRDGGFFSAHRPPSEASRVNYLDVNLFATPELAYAAVNHLWTCRWKETREQSLTYRPIQMTNEVIARL